MTMGFIDAKYLTMSDSEEDEQRTPKFIDSKHIMLSDSEEDSKYIVLSDSEEENVQVKDSTPKVAKIPTLEVKDLNFDSFCDSDSVSSSNDESNTASESDDSLQMTELMKRAGFKLVKDSKVRESNSSDPEAPPLLNIEDFLDGQMSSESESKISTDDKEKTSDDEPITPKSPQKSTSCLEKNSMTLHDQKYRKGSQSDRLQINLDDILEHFKDDEVISKADKHVEHSSTKLDNLKKEARLRHLNQKKDALKTAGPSASGIPRLGDFFKSVNYDSEPAVIEPKQEVVVEEPVLAVIEKKVPKKQKHPPVVKEVKPPKWVPPVKTPKEKKSKAASKKPEEDVKQPLAVVEKENVKPKKDTTIQPSKKAKKSKTKSAVVAPVPGPDDNFVPPKSLEPLAPKEDEALVKKYAPKEEFFDEVLLEQLIESSEIYGLLSENTGSDYSIGSESLHYDLHADLKISNYQTATNARADFVKALSLPSMNHLLNFWDSRFMYFPYVVVFFQYLQHHADYIRVPMTVVAYYSLINDIFEREPFFENLRHLVSDLNLMAALKFICYHKNECDPIIINPDLLSLKMIPLACGLPSSVMYCFTKKSAWKIADLRNEFETFNDEDFYEQVINFIDDRPDLVTLEAHDPLDDFSMMYLKLNENVSLKFCVYDFVIHDMSVAPKLHLRNDQVNSIRQFIPYDF